MVSLREIRKRIHSVDNIKQIAKAMEMVAGVELFKVEKKTFHSRLYFSKMEELFRQFIHGEKHSAFEEKEKGKTAVVIIGADRGLCGSYNSGLFSSADAFLKTLSEEEIELTLFGRKAVSHYRSRGWNIKDKYTEWGGKISGEEIRKCTHQLIERFISGELKAIWIVYTYFVNLLTREVKIKKWFPIDQNDLKKASEDPIEEPIIEPNEEEFFKEILPRWSIAKMQNALDESYASELAARVISMKTANKNAEEMIEQLTLVRNKVRQQDITEELIEIVIGAESLR